MVLPADQMVNELERAANQYDGWTYRASNIFLCDFLEELKFCSLNNLIISMQYECYINKKLQISFRDLDAGSISLDELDNDTPYLRNNYNGIYKLYEHFRHQITTIPECCCVYPSKVSGVTDGHDNEAISPVLDAWLQELRDGISPDRAYITNRECQAETMEIFCAWHYRRLRAGVVLRASTKDMALELYRMKDPYYLDNRNIIYSAHPGSEVFDGMARDITAFIWRVKRNCATVFAKGW